MHSVGLQGNFSFFKASTMCCQMQQHL